MAATDLPPTQPAPPSAALVTPRGRAEAGGEILPVLDLLQPWIDAHAVGAIRIAGPSGSGKSLALAHLAAALGPIAGVSWLDEPEPASVEALVERTLVVFAATRRPRLDLVATIEMAPWDDDDAIEYVLAAHREHSASVMKRVLADPHRHRLLEYLPELWGIALDELAADESIRDVRGALKARLDRLAPPGPSRDRIALRAWHGIEPSEDGGGTRAHSQPPGTLPRLVRHRAVRLLLAAELLVSRLVANSAGPLLEAVLPRDLLSSVVDRASAEPTAIAALEALVAAKERRVHPATATLLLALDPAWRPPGPPTRRLAGALLDGAAWADLDLAGADLSRVSLARADLSRADVSGALLHQANLHGARLARANLSRVKADEIDLRHADLPSAVLDGASLRFAVLAGADLEHASLAGTSLTGANLEGVRLANACLAEASLRRANLDLTDLTGADLSGVDAPDTVFRTARLARAVFSGARLQRSDFEGIEAEGIRFPGANLTGAYLSDSVLPRADFQGANLAQAGLAGVEWEGADLRDVDFTHAVFHMGSSRSGLLKTPIASEGTRTGYYTDESAEQDFKAPEEIRKANFRGADLRGAKVEEADWYLVDLRDTQHSARQRAHFARCRAILRTRARPDPSE